MPQDLFPEPANTAEIGKLDYEPHSLAYRFWRRFKRNRLAWIGLILLVALLAASALAPVIARHDPDDTDLRKRLQPPSRENWLGTDRYGRDVLARLLYGGRVSLTIAFAAVAISVSIGTVAGAVAGFYGGAVDNLLMRSVDIIISLPGLLFLIFIMALFGATVTNLVLVLGLLSWPGTARLVRGEFLSLRWREFTESARAAGAGDLRLIFKHLLPNALAPIIVAATLGVATVILTESGLSFLGLGIQPPQASWGNMLRDGQNHIRNGWWLIAFPGVTIFLTVMSFNLVGDALRDALDPRLK